MTNAPRHTDRPANGHNAAPKVHRFAHEAMACTFELFIPDQQRGYAEQAARAAFAEVERIEQELSRFVSHSDVARINSAPPEEPVQVGMETLDCLKMAAAVNVETNGAFDVTAGAVAETHSPPRAVSPTCNPDGRSPAPVIGMKHLEIDQKNRTVTALTAGLRVDLGGIGKGYALDRVVDLLREWQIHSALIHAGQSSVIGIGGPHEEADAWSVQLRDPGGVRARPASVLLRQCALSGSGSLLHGPHIIDPRSGHPAASAWGAWAKAPSAALSDALSTAFMVMSRSEVDAYCGAHENMAGILALPARGGYELVTIDPEP